jgi:murein DD-endopeptidase MepM/ murein hydrolase activator NlpD
MYGTSNHKEQPVLEPDHRTALYLTIALTDKQTPKSLVHRLELRPEPGDEPAVFQLLGGYTAISSEPLPTVGSPLRGGPWVALYDLTLERGHRRVIYATSGRSHIPGRHAIDWMRPVGWPKSGEGDDVLAVSDAVVVGIHDGMQDTLGDPGRIPLAAASGNYICLGLGNGRFAFYEHLLPGLHVHVGDRVRRGQVIAKVGMTGHATTPHLHFHVADTSDPLAAEGLPYALSGTTLLGWYASADDVFTGHAWSPVSSARFVVGLPAPGSVVSFDAPEARGSM